MMAQGHKANNQNIKTQEGSMMAETKEQARTRITSRLVELREQGQALVSEQAELFWTVQEQELFKPTYNSLADYAEAIGYTKNHVYMMVRVHKNELVRPHLQALGIMKANALDKAQRDGKLTKGQVTQQANKAKDMTAKAFVAHAKGLPKAPKAEKANKGPTLKSLQAKRDRLIKTIANMEKALEEAKAELENTKANIKALFAADSNKALEDFLAQARELGVDSLLPDNIRAQILEEAKAEAQEKVEEKAQELAQREKARQELATKA